MPVKILVINEPFVKGFCRTQRWAARTRGRVLRAPDWLAYCSAVLERDGFDVELFDFPANNWDKDKLASLVSEKLPDFVVLDSTTPSIYSDIECARICKEQSGTKIIMVGPHVSALPKETLALAQGAVDVGAVGEYDYTVRDIINNFDRLTDVRGVVFWEKGVIKATEPRGFIENLDEVPFPAWHHLNLMKYFDGSKLYPYIDIISGRGCPNQCIFCLWPQVMHGTRYRLRSPKNVVDEIEYDIKLCPQVLKGGEFFFEDDTFTVDKNRAMAICEEILKRNLKIIFSVNARVDSYDDRMFALMKRAGCRELLVGFESADQDILNKVHKNITVGQMYEFMNTAKKHDLEVHGCFVFGLSGETKETIQKTADLALALGLTTVQFSAAVPFPGTSYYQLCKEKGWLKSCDWKDWLLAGEQASVVEYENLSSKEINRSVDAALKKFYLRPGFLFNFIFKNRSFVDLYRKLRGGLNFFSYLFTSIKTTGKPMAFDAVLARGHATGKWRPEGSSLDKMNEPRISIIVPVYNAEKTIKKSIESLLCLDYSNYEVLIVDDGSADKTFEIIGAYKNRITIIRSQHLGPSKARNDAAKIAQGDFLAFTDADCIVEKDWLRQLLKGFMRDTIVSVGGIQLSPKDESEFGKRVQVFFELTGFLGGYIKRKNSNAITDVTHNPSCNVMYRRDVFLEIGGFDETLWPSEDVDLDYRLKKKGNRFIFNPKAIVYHYRPQTVKVLSKMMFRYGVTQGILTRRYGFFRKVQFLPIFFILSIALVLFNRNLLWLIPIFYLFLLVKIRRIVMVNDISLFALTTLIVWDYGFIKGLCHKAI